MGTMNHPKIFHMVFPNCQDSHGRAGLAVRQGQEESGFFPRRSNGHGNDWPCSTSWWFKSLFKPKLGWLECIWKPRNIWFEWFLATLTPYWVGRLSRLVLSKVDSKWCAHAGMHDKQVFLAMSMFNVFKVDVVCPWCSAISRYKYVVKQLRRLRSKAAGNKAGTCKRVGLGTCDVQLAALTVCPFHS